LRSGYGRICNICKEKKRLAKQAHKTQKEKYVKDIFAKAGLPLKLSQKTDSNKKVTKTKSAKTSKPKGKKKSTSTSSSCPDPYCNGKMVLKSGRYGQFYGCSNYFKTGCKKTRQA